MTTTTPDLEHCTICNSTDIRVIVCTHILDNTDPHDGRFTTNLGASPQDIPRHECSGEFSGECGEHALCGDCWSDL